MKTAKEKKPKVGESPFCQRFDAFLKQTSAKNSNNLAIELGDTNPVKYRRWLAGEATPNAGSLKPIAKHYAISVDWLLEGKGEMFVKSASAPEGKVIAMPIVMDIATDEHDELNQLRTESVKDKALIEELRQQLRELKQEKRESDREWREVIIKEGFPESDSHNHRFEKLVRESCRVEGLVRYDVKAEGKVIALNAEPKHFVLDSLRYQHPVRQTA